MGGHVFVVRGDVRKLRCDARLVPAYENNTPKQIWFLDDESKLRMKQADESWESSSKRVRPLGASERGPALWVAKVGLDSATTLTRAMEGVSEFLQRAAADLQGTKPVSERCKPLIALHVVATGQHNWGAHKGDAIVALLDVLDAFVVEREVDVAIVAGEEETYAALQVTRSMRHGDVSTGLESALHEVARGLAAHARHGNLTALVGAGLSMNAGLPNWSGLLRGVAQGVNLRGPEPTEDLVRYASWVEQIMGPRAFRAAIAARCCAARHALGHALLASMPIREFVTLNYDQLLEDAADAAGSPFEVIPHGRVGAGRRWLLKLHGSVDRLDDIVITERDYERFDDWRSAFRGVVEAQLVTRHMLFVGFGMADPNVGRVLDSVARATRRDDGGRDAPVGTLLHFDAIAEHEKRRYPLSFVRVGEHENGIGPRARQVEILLDDVARLAEDGTHHLLDRRFDGLHPTEVAVRKQVADFLTALHVAHPDSRLRREVMGHLRPLMGGDPELTRLLKSK
ncbi:MAG: hypothetical protein JWM10_3519 [Myxococcaceae bacterium]|nr:hypothetical protein [Myxococcaceae bacterium]